MKTVHFDYNRLGNQMGRQQGGGGAQQQAARWSFDPTNCCLEVKKIPRGLNISILNNHSSKFGKIVNLQVKETKILDFYMSQILI